MNIELIQLWPLLAGLGLFLFGMGLMEESLSQLLRGSVKSFIRRHTHHPLKALLSGAVITAILQSSTLVTLLVMSFAGAGILGLENGIGIILGANIGTTFTGWLVSLLGFKFNIQAVVLPILALGGLGLIFFRKKSMVRLFGFIMGFGFLFMGLAYMKDGFAVFSEHIDFNLLNGRPMVLFLLFGFVLSAAIHSSSGSMVIFLSLLSEGMIDLHQAFYLVIGSDLGTTMTALISTFKGNTIKKKTGWAQFYINVISAAIALVMMNPISQFISVILQIHDPLFSLVAFHSSFNFLGILFIFPFLGKFTSLINRIISPRETDLVKFIKEVSPDESTSGFIALQKEIGQYLQQAIFTNQQFISSSEQNEENELNYQTLKKYENEVKRFSLSLQNLTLSEAEAEKLELMTASVRYATLSAKDIKDVLQNLESIQYSGVEELSQFNQTLIALQSDLYGHIQLILQDQTQEKTDPPASIKRLILDINQNLSKLMVQMSAHRKDELDFSSLLNLIHEINNSNEYLYRSLELIYSARNHAQ